MNGRTGREKLRTMRCSERRPQLSFLKGHCRSSRPRRSMKNPPIPHPRVRFRSSFAKNLEVLAGRFTFPQWQGRMADVPLDLTQMVQQCPNSTGREQTDRAEEANPCEQVPTKKSFLLHRSPDREQQEPARTARPARGVLGLPAGRAPVAGALDRRLLSRRAVSPRHGPMASRATAQSVRHSLQPVCRGLRVLVPGAPGR